MALVEMDEVIVDSALWARVKADDAEARQELRKALHGTILYMHAFPISPHEEIVTLHDLEGANVLNCIRLNCEYLVE